MELPAWTSSYFHCRLDSVIYARIEHEKVIFRQHIVKNLRITTVTRTTNTLGECGVITPECERSNRESAMRQEDGIRKNLPQ